MKISFDLLSDLAGTVDGAPRGNYSGRGMYGATCVGIVMNPSDMLQLGANISALDDQELRSLLMYKYSTDSMGYDTIIYWPGITCDDSPEDSEDF